MACLSFLLCCLFVYFVLALVWFPDCVLGSSPVPLPASVFLFLLCVFLCFVCFVCLFVFLFVCCFAILSSLYL